MDHDKDRELLLAEIIVKVNSIEKLLIKANVITGDELVAEMKKMSEQILEYVKKNQLQPRN